MPVPVQDVGGGVAPEVAAAVVGSEGVEALQDEAGAVAAAVAAAVVDSQVVAGAEEVAADAGGPECDEAMPRPEEDAREEGDEEGEREGEGEGQAKKARARSAGSRRRIRARGPPR